MLQDCLNPLRKILLIEQGENATNLANKSIINLLTNEDLVRPIVLIYDWISYDNFTTKWPIWTIHHMPTFYTKLCQGPSLPHKFFLLPFPLLKNEAMLPHQTSTCGALAVGLSPPGTRHRKFVSEGTRAKL